MFQMFIKRSWYSNFNKLVSESRNQWYVNTSRASLDAKQPDPSLVWTLPGFSVSPTQYPSSTSWPHATFVQCGRSVLNTLPFKWSHKRPMGFFSWWLAKGAHESHLSIAFFYVNNLSLKKLCFYNCNPVIERIIFDTTSYHMKFYVFERMSTIPNTLFLRGEEYFQKKQ